MSCAAMKVRCDGQPGSTCSRCLASGHACLYRNQGTTSSRPAPTHSDNASIYSPQTDSAVSSNGQMATEDAILHPTLGATSCSMNTTYQTLSDGPADDSLPAVTGKPDLSPP